MSYSSQDTEGFNTKGTKYHEGMQKRKNPLYPFVTFVVKKII